ncbi:MAG: hypothetical protein AAB305_01175 [Candidatus Zixiibacteriota bacterium]
MVAKVINRNICLLAFSSIVLSALIGCGTAHHFLPARPIEKGKWEINVAWHMDFDGLTAPGQVVWPSVNAYYGMTKRDVIGAGGTLSLFLPTIDHITLASYFHQQKDNWVIAWSHVRAFTFTDNPLLELGGSYSFGDTAFSSMASLGIGIGTSPKWKLSSPQSCAAFPRVISPQVSYSVRGRDACVAFSHRLFAARNMIQRTFPKWPPTSDTVFAAQAGEVVSFEPTQNKAELGSFYYMYRYLVTKSGDSVPVYLGPYSVLDRLTINILEESELDYWMNAHGYTVARLNNTWAIVDYMEIHKAIDSGQPVVITRAPQSFVDWVENMNHWIKDNSIGWAIFPKMYKK